MVDVALIAEAEQPVPHVPILEAVFELIPRLSWSPDELLTHQRDALRQTLRHAVHHSRFHRTRLEGIDLERIDPTDLSVLPTMTKADLMAHWDDVVTDDRLSLAAARAHLDRVDAEGLRALDDRYLVLTSGGSTGEPGIFCWSLEEMGRFGASAIRWAAAAGEGPPARPAWIAARSPRHPSGAAALLTGATLIPVDQPVSAIVQQLDALQPDAISTVCSMLSVLTEEARSGRLQIPVERISVFGDVLDRDAAAAAAEVFGVEPTEGYPTTDLGCLAQQVPGEPGLYLNDDLLLVEAVDADEHPVAAGVAADHLLVTSLHQWTMPLIRYRVDDRVIIDPEPGRYTAYRRLASIDGRSDDLFRYGDVTVHPHVFRTAIGRHLEITDFEVEQTERGAVVRVVAGSTLAEHPTLRGELVDGLRAAGVPAREVELIAVDALGRTAVGKRRRFVPLGG